MANVIVDKNKIDILANAISNKSGEPVTMTLDEMVEAVDGIESGITPTGTLSITTNGTQDVTDYASVNVNVSAPSPTLQTKTKTYTPTETAQTESITADVGYDGLDTVSISVGAISSTYVGSGIDRRDSTDLTASGATVSVPSGYYQNNASKAVPSGSATPASSISGTSATVSTGTNTLTLSKTVSNTPQVSAGYVSSGTAGNTNVSLTASVTTKAAATIYPSASDQSIASGTYLTGAQTIKGVTYSNLTAANIKKDVVVTIGDSADADRILSVTGTYEGGGGGTLTVKTATTTKTSIGQTISFSSLSGEPKYWFLRATTNLSSSGSTTYYYITDLFYDGTNIKGNTFRIGSTRRVQNITSGVTQSYSSNTLTITAGSSSTATPGQFYGTSNFGYELVYIY